MFKNAIYYRLCVACILLWPLSAAAQNIPAAADAARVGQEAQPNIERPSTNTPLLDSVVSQTPSTNAPEGAENVTLKLANINLRGASTFMADKVKNIYQDDIDQEIVLSRIWEIADEITKYYRDQGYFLSRAFVPAQELDEGESTVVIQVIEGYIGEVEFIEDLKEKNVIHGMIESLRTHKPMKAEKLESFLLLLNDLPGVSVRAILEPLSNAEDEGAVKLSLVQQATSGMATISYNNFGSRFLGPHQITASYDASIIPLQQTRLSLTSSVPFQELKQVNLTHKIAVYRGLNLELSASHVNTEPGHTLKVNNIESKSTSFELGFTWRIIRQRLENLSAGFKFTSKNSESDILGTELSRDKIRALRANLSYDFSDKLKGYNLANLDLSQGLNFLGASEAGDTNLSRAQAKPDFTKVEASYTRFQNIGANWLGVGGVAGQWASGPLYSSEEFGYGGQGFGRAYDPSEITGDHGVAAMLEIRYQGIDPWRGTKTTPYAFYDIGKIWNDDAGQVPHASGSSAGLGVRLSHEGGLSAGLSVAQPLTRSIATPVHGNGKNPRVLFNISYAFKP